MITYLYHKKHLKTGLNYFGKTTRNPYKYKGSGIYWNDHLKKHGNYVETVNIWTFSNLEECSKFAIEFSIKNNIVESEEWANLCLENGLDGGDKFIYMDSKKKDKINKLKSEKQLIVWMNRSRKHQANTTSKIWKERDPAINLAIASKISKTLRNKTSAQKEDALQKRRKTLAKRPQIICHHCGKVGKSLSNMKRYHLDKCKFKID